MNILIGLGNTEDKYIGTRHNIGKDFVNRFVRSLNYQGFFEEVKRVARKKFSKDYQEEWADNDKLKASLTVINDVSGGKLICIKPNTLMNESGVCVKKVLDYYKPDNVYVVYDDLDLVIGEYKILMGRASKVHNGLASISESVGDAVFNKINFVKIGVREKHIPMSVKKFGLNPNTYVLSKFTKNDKSIVQKLMDDELIPDVLKRLSK